MTALRSILLLGTLLLVGCDEYFHTPAQEPAQVGVTFRQITGGEGSAFDAADNARVEVQSGNSTLFAGVLDLSPQGSGVSATVTIDLPDGATSASVFVELRRGEEPLFTGASSVGLTPGETTEATVTLDPVVAQLALVAPPTFTFYGQAASLEGDAVFATGDVVAGIDLTWQSLDPGVVSVEETTQGWRAVGLADGQASLQASGGGQVATVDAVVYAEVVEVEVMPSSLTLGPGQSQQLSALVLDAGGSPITARPPTWSATPASVVTVDSDGVVTGVAPGQGVVTAIREGVSGEVSVVVSFPGPGVETLPAQDVTTGSALLRAEVDPRGQATTVVFEYSTDPELASPSTTAATPVGASSLVVVVSRSVSGLPDGEQIYYRALATSALGSAEGEILSFTTPDAPEAPSGLTGSYSEGVELSWTDNSETETRFEVEREIVASEGRFVDGPSRVFESIGGTGANTTRFFDFSPPTGELLYRVRACHESGCSAWSESLLWYYGLPPAVFTPPATEVGLYEVRLHAAVNPLNGPTEIYWEVGYNPGFVTPPPDIYPESPIAVGSGNVDVELNLLIESIQPGVRYARVVAINPWGVTYGNAVSFFIQSEGEIGW